MFVLPKAAEPLITPFRSAFTRPSFNRFVVLLVGAIVTFGRHSVSRILWTLGRSAEGTGDPSSYHRFFSCARWSLWPLGKALAAMVLELVPEDQPVLCAIDDTVDGHAGKKVWGKGCHRDAVRSGPRGTHTVKKWGHRWVTLAVLVKLPFATRPWALPVLSALYRTPRVDEQQGRRRHKTPCDLACGLAAAMLHWFGQRRRFILLGDGGFASHELARFCHRHKDRLTLIARAHPNMNLHALPSPACKPCRQTLWRRRRGISRQRCRKGRKLPSPRQTVATVRRRAGRWHRPTVAELQWYGQSRRSMELISACGGWYRGRGNGTAALVPVRWVHTHDPLERDRWHQDWFFCTDPSLSPATIVESFAGRWSIEVTYEEARAHLGLQTTRQRCEHSVLRTAPCLLGLFTWVSLLFTRLWQRQQAHNNRCTSPPSLPSLPLHDTPCYHKSEPTFADALYATRRMLWDGCLLPHVFGPRRVNTLPPKLRRTLLTYLAEAA